MEEDEELIWAKNWEPVPKVFWSDLTGKPFENCIMCEKYLLNDGTLYMIEKAFKSYNTDAADSTIFEYAICLECADKMQSKLSQESRLKMDAYYQERVDLFERRKKLEEVENNLGDRIGECLLLQQPAAKGGEYQIYAQCDGKDMVYLDMPFMICGEAVDELIQLMSNETLDELNGFMNDLTGGPPELRELLEAGPRVFV